MTEKAKEEKGSQKAFMDKVAIIQHKLKAPKSQTNDFGKYKYRKCEDILESVKPLLEETGLVLRISDDVVEVGGRVYVKATAILSDHENSIAVTGWARESESRKGMDDSQITGATSSYARKYALNGLFCIDDTADADSMDNTTKVAEKGNSAQTKATSSDEPKPQSNWLSKCVALGKEQFSSPESFKKWRVESGLVENMKGASDFDLLCLHQKLKEFSDCGVE